MRRCDAHTQGTMVRCPNKGTKRAWLVWRGVTIVFRLCEQHTKLGTTPLEDR